LIDRTTIAQKGGDNLTTEVKIEKGISDIVGALTDPIIVFPGGWGDSLPEWLKQAITMERLVMNMRALKGEEMTGTDAEACAYLYAASLEAPMDNDWTQIYLYVAGKVVSRGRDTEVPGDIKVDSLNDYQTGLLRDLKDWIYEQRIKHRQERRRAENAKAMAELKAKAPRQLRLGV
jgi:hypothetical protein